MLVSYATTKLLKLCTTQQKLVKAFGKPCAEEIEDRITTLMAMPTLGDIPIYPPERRHKLDGRRKGQWAVEAHGGVRICLVPANTPLPRCADGSVDLTLVTEVEIVFVGDYHGES
ncbi:killer suppression protein HigA [Rhodospirillum rubrum]|uniref:Killer suppression protein HigA, putative n=1 Tax=Rhodospirillum rubrum (strain ATCC 11170 / ATH 1.1.1 / DSM 467 / LMG 4362 / NCIMB 8255 / S1) TaxID=269796 RepID=Q2RYI5_RHORT|nr:killer suppression protein HigA [Rhodospirillum rubrum]ABC20810.1 killer suppression protein HigA, putative [Rhodospirillum rubrum ATCC 11170]AEO46476.1 killer suppression protein HigA [Rhodospirillum rubrum F11]MBK5956333.1 killer suppression protein HigA [Rhodospirillum rubrum]QXG80515.1 killer suppression protein HigA [Rhodospirillum rubrum]HCF18736.1 killer suppression protein HigA [Rhodospirillum rubrum]